METIADRLQLVAELLLPCLKAGRRPGNALTILDWI